MSASITLREDTIVGTAALDINLSVRDTVDNLEYAMPGIVLAKAMADAQRIVFKHACIKPPTFIS